MKKTRMFSLLVAVLMLASFASVFAFAEVPPMPEIDNPLTAIFEQISGMFTMVLDMIIGVFAMIADALYSIAN